jgi:anti-anti-sigma factor
MGYGQNGTARNGTAKDSQAPAHSRPRLRIKVIDGLTMVEFLDADGFLGEDAIAEIGDQLYRLAEEGHSRLVLNLCGLRYMSGRMVAKLVGLHLRVERARGQLVLCGVDAMVHDVLRICHVDRVLAVCTDLAEALAVASAARDQAQVK